MKNFNSKLVVLLIGMSLMGVGCGKSSQFQTNSTTDTTTDGSIPSAPGGTYSDVGTTASTSKIDFTPVSMYEFNSYVALHALNNPTDIKVAIDLKNDGSGRYSGSVKISYNDAGKYWESILKSGTSINQDLYNLKDVGLSESEYNRWYTVNGNQYFSGFFQDSWGGIVLTIDSVVNQGDGQGSGTVQGTIYYKNFAQTYSYQSQYRRCWYIRQGPWNCRADEVINKSSLVPGNGYRKLGTFTGLMKAAAFK